MTTTGTDDAYPEHWGYQKRGEEPATDDGQPISNLRSGLSNYGTPQDDPDAYPTNWGYQA